MKFNQKFIIGENVTLGKRVKIGDRTVIYDNVCIGDDTIIANDCVIGEPVTEYYRDDAYKNKKTIIGKNSLIRSHAIIYAGSTFGTYLETGHRVIVREETIVGHHCMIGTMTDIQGFCLIGNYSRFHSNVFVSQKSVVGNFVFIYPCVVLTDDPTPPSQTLQGVKIHDYAQIGAGSILIPGVTIGENCLIGAGSVVTKNVSAYSLVFGNPGKRICDVRKVKSREKSGESHYPWMYHFSRGMPWEKEGYIKWKKMETIAK